MMTLKLYLMVILMLIGILTNTTIMEQKQELSTISPALKAKTKEELLAIIARKDAVELSLREEILKLKEMGKVTDSTDNLLDPALHRNSGFITKILLLIIKLLDNLK